MLFMVIEDFRGEPTPMRDRFMREGRMLPDGVFYHASWIDPARARCYQVIEAASPDALMAWTKKWSVDFEIFPIVTSQTCWAEFGKAGST